MTADRRPRRWDMSLLISVGIAIPCAWLGFGTVAGVWIRLDMLSFAFGTVILAAALAAPFIFLPYRLPGWVRFALISTGAAWAIGAFITEYFQIDPITSTSFTTGTGL